MGGRGSSSSQGGGSLGAGGGGGLLSNSQAQQNIANQAPNTNNTPITAGGVTTLSSMSDDNMAQLIRSSRNVDMPNHLADVHDRTQSFVYSAGLNEKPMVLDDAAFAQFMKDNKIPQSQILSRSVGGAQYTVNGTHIRMSSDQVTALYKDGSLNYVGGKYGGKVHGAGSYFDMNGGRNTGYASGSTMLGVLNPKTAKIIDDGSALQRAVASFKKSHPKTAKEIGALTNDTKAIYAACMGYNVIRAYSYHNVIDRSATVIRQRNL